jgi:hypothetical protein
MRNRAQHRLQIIPLAVLGFLTLMGASLPNPAEVGEADWKFMEKDDEGLWFYDAEMIEWRSDGQFTVPTKKRYAEEAVLDAVEKYGKKYENLDYVLAVWKIDCGQRKFKLLSATFYSRTNTVIEGYHTAKNADLPPEDIPPDSYLELLRKKVCR